MKAFDELKNSGDSNYRYAISLSRHLAPKSLKLGIFGSNYKESELEGTIFTKKRQKNSDSEVKNIPAVVF